MGSRLSLPASSALATALIDIPAINNNIKEPTIIVGLRPAGVPEGLGLVEILPVQTTGA